MPVGKIVVCCWLRQDWGWGGDWELCFFLKETRGGKKKKTVATYYIHP